MPESDLVFIRCQLSRGGFSSERVFRLDLGKDDQGKGKVFLGSAPVQYCQTEAGKPLKPDEPPPGKRIPGQVAARIVRENQDQTVWLSFPDGSVTQVPVPLLVTPKIGKTPDVSLKS
jgi:hypothetical protein